LPWAGFRWPVGPGDLAAFTQAALRPRL